MFELSKTILASGNPNNYSIVYLHSTRAIMNNTQKVVVARAVVIFCMRKEGEET